MSAELAQRLYLFTRFERFWHWSQALLVLSLLGTGARIHGWIGTIPFRGAVLVHELAACMLVTLWVFAIFWHFTTGEWRQYIPTSRMVLAVARYYALGMFLGEEHPFAKTRAHKHNPLQRLAYLALKVVINPLMWLTGLVLLVAANGAMSGRSWVLSWGDWARLHSMAAYLMLVFVIAHVYLTTTGKTLTSYIRAMLTGWEVAPGDATAGPRPGGRP